MLDFLKRKAIAHELGEENMGRIKAVLAWFTAEPGRKRIVGMLLLATAQTLKGIDVAQRTLCEAAVLGARVCAIHPQDWVVYVGALNTFIQTYLVPGADTAGLLLAGWGVAHAIARAKDDGHSNATAVIAAMTSSIPPPMPPATATVVPQEPKV